ncbi:MAG: DUF2007 domain-containing protein [Parvibaculum sp.]|uniref:putative signal transducing protein n=1 Tax=Parvibaculum sp. TaxID=2024848 RepID=UPI0032EC43A1
MKELVRTGDPVLISYLTHRLTEAGIESFGMDAHMQRSLGILPQRIMVVDEDYEAARRILDEVRLEG